MNRHPFENDTSPILATTLVRQSDSLDRIFGQTIFDGRSGFFPSREVGTSAIRKIALTGGPVVTLWPGNATAGSPKMAQDENFIYWINGTQVGKVSKSGGPAFSYQSGFDHRMAIGVDDTSVYWVTDYALLRATPK